MTVDWSKAPTFEAPSKADDTSTDTLETEPRRRKTRSDKGVPRGPRTEGTPRRSRGSLKEPIGGMLVMLNLPVSMFAPTDALDGAEIEALATALDEQQKMSPRFRKYLQQMLGVASGGQLLAVAGMIGARRAARHGLLGDAGETVDLTLGNQLAAMTGEKTNTPTYVKPEQKSQPITPPRQENIQDAGTIIGWTPPVG